MAAKEDQLERFRALRGEFAERYAAARRFDAPRLVEPEWRERNAELEEALLPAPPTGFLREPAILYSMFLGERYAAAELAAIERLRDGDGLDGLLEEDPVGEPPSTANLIHHLHHLLRFRQETGAEPAALDRIVEWGGGYGSMARLFARLRGDELAYALVDTPLFATVQWLYLSSVFGPQRVDLRLEERPIEPQAGRFTVVPLGLWQRLPRDAELFVSTWALNESAAEAQRAVAASGWFGATHLLLGMHEGAPLAAIAEADGARVVGVGDFMPSQPYVLR